MTGRCAGDAVGSGRGNGSEDGFLGGLDALAFGSLVFVTGTLLVLNAWSVVDTRMAVGAAAREAAGRVAAVEVAAYAQHLPQREEAREELARDARRLAMQALAQHGRDVSEVDPLTVVTFSDLPPAPRCAFVEATVTFDAPTIGLPFIGAFGGGGIPVSVTHRERIDPFRAGLPGEASCG